MAKTYEEFAVFYMNKFFRISKKKVRVKLVYDISRDCTEPTYLPGKLYITAPNKRGEVGYICECRGVRWFDNLNSIDRLEEAKKKFPNYIRQIRLGYYKNREYTFIPKIAKLVNHNKNFKGLKL